MRQYPGRLDYLDDHVFASDGGLTLGLDNGMHVRSLSLAIRRMLSSGMKPCKQAERWCIFERAVESPETAVKCTGDGARAGGV